MEDPIVKDHTLGIRGLLRVYPFRTLFRGVPFWVALGLALIFGFLFQVTLGDTFPILKQIVGLVLDMYPNLLGFNLGGYALIVGFGNLKIVKEMTQKSKDETASLYQTISGVFAMAILAQAVTMLLALLIHLASQINFVALGVPEEGRALFWIPNCVLLLSLQFMLFYSVFLLPKVVIYVFDFSQLVHFHLVLEKDPEE